MEAFYNELVIELSVAAFAAADHAVFSLSHDHSLRFTSVLGRPPVFQIAALFPGNICNFAMSLARVGIGPSELV